VTLQGSTAATRNRAPTVLGPAPGPPSNLPYSLARGTAFNMEVDVFGHWTLCTGQLVFEKGTVLLDRASLGPQAMPLTFARPLQHFDFESFFLSLNREMSTVKRMQHGLRFDRGSLPESLPTRVSPASVPPLARFVQLCQFPKFLARPCRSSPVLQINLKFLQELDGSRNRFSR